jgi:hypothetical protein
MIPNCITEILVLPTIDYAYEYAHLRFLNLVGRDLNRTQKERFQFLHGVAVPAQAFAQGVRAHISISGGENARDDI